MTGENYLGTSDGGYVKPAENPNLPTIEGDTCLRSENNKTVIRCLFNLDRKFKLIGRHKSPFRYLSFNVALK